MPADQPMDAMVTLAALVSRSEALVVASMLEAAGVQVFVGGAGHASVEVNSLALGGHRLWVPAAQHLHASRVLREVLGEEEWGFSYGLRRAVLRVCRGWGAVLTLAGIYTWLLGAPDAKVTERAWLAGRDASNELIYDVRWG